MGPACRHPLGAGPALDEGSVQFPTLLLAAAHRAELGALLREPSMGHRHPGRERTGRVGADVGAAAGTRLPLTDRELWAAPTAQC